MDKTFRDFLRMCVANKDCKDCPIKNRLEPMCYTGNCNVWMNNNLELAENIVSQWAAEHPETTYKSYLMERFPKADMRHCALPSCLVKVRGPTNVMIRVFAIALVAGTDR